MFKDGEDGHPLGLVLRPPAPTDRSAGVPLYLGRDPEGVSHVAVLTPRPDGDVDPAWVNLRAVAADLSATSATMAAAAVGVGNWHRTHQFCPRCGAATRPSHSGWVRQCVADASLHFPRTDPAVIMAVVDSQDRLLLAQGSAFRERGMSVLAGFVEPGETFAAAVAREVAEEVGVKVTDVAYVADQPWPFPASLMIGCTARALGETTLRPQADEILTARWFSRRELLDAVSNESVLLPGRVSISRHLIERWFAGPLPGPDWSLRR